MDVCTIWAQYTNENGREHERVSVEKNYFLSNYLNSF